jgi:hypothetical protein
LDKFDDRQILTLFVPLIQTVDKNGKVHYTTIRRELARGQREAAIKKREKEYRKQWRRANPELARKEDTDKVVETFKGFCILAGIVFLVHYPIVGLILLVCCIIAFIIYHHYKRNRKGNGAEQIRSEPPGDTDGKENRVASREDRASEIWRIMHTERLTWDERHDLSDEYRSLVSGGSDDRRRQSGT